MTKTLNITNGDIAVTIMRQADISGDFLPWRDVLHDGPVPGGLSLEALSEIRTDFIVSQGWGEEDRPIDVRKKSGTKNSIKSILLFRFAFILSSL